MRIINLPFFSNLKMSAAVVNPIILKLNAEILNPLIVLLFGLALAFFLWGVFQFMISGDSDREEGRKHMLWGLIGIFIMFSAFAIMKLIAGTIGVPVPPPVG